MRRPFRDKDLVDEDNFPLINRRRIIQSLRKSENLRDRLASGEDNNERREDEDVVFDSIDDLPESQMLREYVKQQADYLGLPVDKVINTQPVKDYMKRLGLWEQAVEENR